ncbi:hypothetical protein [Mesomycoplasma ovipneumoniae]|uniref:hypothetical protein n=1 Tax=Mesomycoplasma ovipneumoniae TaxID=29562 RepID=UPI0028AAF2BF|nr:hypothetical protein [Mesomycoplasma ovipneumoniae]WNM16902.1 hypothetical protein RNM19_02060 [Mesomycoplasma ovipneumoniae]
MAIKLPKLRNLFILSTPIVFLVATSCGVSQKIADKLGPSLSFDVNGNYVFTIKNDKFKDATEVVAHFEGEIDGADTANNARKITAEVSGTINNSTASFNTTGKLQYDYKWSLKKIKVGSEEISQDQFPDDLKDNIWFEKKIAIVKQDTSLWIDPKIQLLRNWINTDENVELKAEFIRIDDPNKPTTETTEIINGVEVKKEDPTKRRIIDTTFNTSLNKFQAALQEGYKFNRILIQSKNNSFATISLPYKPF